MKMPKNWEKSAEDKRMDKAGAKKAGVPVAKWEDSAADRKADIKAAMKVKRK